MRNKKLHIIYLFLFAILLLLASLPLFADKLILKSGETSFGRALSVTATHVEWQEQGKVRKIPHTDILKIEVGYDGVPVCAEYPGLTEDPCNLLLHRMTKNSASFTSKTSPLKLDVVALTNLKSMKMEINESLNYETYLSTGIRGLWDTSTFKGIGTLVSIEGTVWKLQPDLKNSETLLLNQNEIYSFETIKKQPPLTTAMQVAPKLIPGYAQVQRKDYKKSILLFGGALLSGAGMIYEYNESVNAINNDREYIPTGDGRIIIVGNLISNEKYEFHNQRFQAYVGIFSMIIAYSLLDSFYLGQIESENGNKSSVWIRSDISPVSYGRERYSNLNPGFSQHSLHYTISVESRF
ncbi:MAG: hypothetical protein O9264_08425 [Leptospira sp.]|nr:hypothetical protein [Leptospira sp.]